MVNRLIGLVAIVLIVLVLAFIPVAVPQQNLTESEQSTSEPTIISGSEVVTVAPTSEERAQPDSIESSTNLEPILWLVFAVVILAIATSIAVAISFYLYRWRKILLSKPHLVVPEQLGAWVEEVDSGLHELTKASKKHAKLLYEEGRETKNNVSRLSEMFMTLQAALDSRDEEIRRLRRGYDKEILRKFVSRFIRVDQLLVDISSSAHFEQQDLDNVQRLLADAFEECGVERFEPDEGQDYRDAQGVADNPKSTASDEHEKFQIIEVEECGYHMRGPEGFEVIVPARVVISTGPSEG